eukprot:3367891-Ditylum_brightwellii.AAC.1
MIRRKRKEILGQDWDGDYDNDDDDDDDGREYKMRKRAKRVGSTWKANQPEISPLGFINVPDKVWKKELSKGKRDFVASYNKKNLKVKNEERKGKGIKRRLGCNFDDVREEEENED